MRRDFSIGRASPLLHDEQHVASLLVGLNHHPKAGDGICAPLIVAPVFLSPNCVRDSHGERLQRDLRRDGAFQSSPVRGSSGLGAFGRRESGLLGKDYGKEAWGDRAGGGRSGDSGPAGAGAGVAWQEERPLWAENRPPRAPDSPSSLASSPAISSAAASMYGRFGGDQRRRPDDDFDPGHLLSSLDGFPALGTASDAGSNASGSLPTHRRGGRGGPSPAPGAAGNVFHTGVGSGGRGGDSLQGHRDDSMVSSPSRSRSPLRVTNPDSFQAVAVRGGGGGGEGGGGRENYGAVGGGHSRQRSGYTADRTEDVEGAVQSRAGSANSSGRTSGGGGRGHEGGTASALGRGSAASTQWHPAPRRLSGLAAIIAARSEESPEKPVSKRYAFVCATASAFVVCSSLLALR